MVEQVSNIFAKLFHIRKAKIKEEFLLALQVKEVVRQLNHDEKKLGMHFKNVVTKYTGKHKK